MNTHGNLNTLRQVAYYRLDVVRKFLRSQGLSETNIRLSVAFSEILCSLPPSEWPWLLQVQHSRVEQHKHLKQRKEP